MSDSLTLYTSGSSDYASSETNNPPAEGFFKYTPFPSLTNIQKQKIDEIKAQGAVDKVLHEFNHEISTNVEEESKPDVSDVKTKNSCCYLC